MKKILTAVLFAGCVTALSLAGITSTPRTAHANPCISTCYPCDWFSVLYSDGQPFNNSHDPNIESCDYSVSCGGICGTEAPIVASAEAAAAANDPRRIIALLRGNHGVRFNVARRSIQVLSQCNPGAIVANFPVSQTVVAALRPALLGRAVALAH